MRESNRNEPSGAGTGTGASPNIANFYVAFEARSRCCRMPNRLCRSVLDEYLMTNRIENIHLEADPAAAPFEKHERVSVRFAAQAGVLESREGANRYSAGDALITGSTGDRWTVSRGRFNVKYKAVPPLNDGEDGWYDNIPVAVLAKQIAEPFVIARSAGGDWIAGRSMDWMIQYAPGDFGIVEDAKFRSVYRPLETSTKLGG